MTPNEYLLSCKIALQVQTDYALAKALDVPRPRIHDWTKGIREIDDEGAAKIALALGLPLGEVLADLRAQGAKTEKSREFWRSFLSRTRSAAAMLALLICSVIYGPALAPGFGGTNWGKRRRGWA